MKRKIQRSLAVVILLSMTFSLILYIFIQVMYSHNSKIEESKVLLSQIERILAVNEVDEQRITEEFRRESLNKARTLAYMVQCQPEIMEDIERSREIAELLSVDELHFFNTEGTIVAGTLPKYYGYNFNSGEQMMFFLPMLEDKNLQLCQPITPNTAEGKLMQYAAVWREDGKGIVQIGNEPKRVLAATRKNELSYIFSLLTPGDKSMIYAVDADTYEIVGATKDAYAGKTLMDVGISKDILDSGKTHFHARIDGKKYFVVQNDVNNHHVLLFRLFDSEGIYSHILSDVMSMIIYITLLAAIMYYYISQYLDKTIVPGIREINGKLQCIAEGNLSDRVEVETVPEFAQLSSHINYMVNSILASADKLSSVLDMAEIRIGMFEYRPDEHQVMVTPEVWEVLHIDEEKRNEMLTDYSSFDQGVRERLDGAVEGEKDIFRLKGETTQYIKLKVFLREESVFGLLMDVTKDIEEKKRIEQERDEDPLTGLYQRRAFSARAMEIMNNPDVMKYGAVLVMDADNLKGVNDKYGHVAGDRYLCKIAGVISSCSAPHQITSRMSGDEFIQLIYGCETEEELLHYVYQVVNGQSGNEVNVSASDKVSVSFSVGYAVYPKESRDFRVLFKSADARMYANKRMKKTSRGNDLHTH